MPLFGYTIVDYDDYCQLIRRENASDAKIAELNAKIETQRDTINTMSDNMTQLRADINRYAGKYSVAVDETEALQKTIVELEAANKDANRNYIAAEAAQDREIQRLQEVEDRLCKAVVAAQETLEERDAELARAVDQATSLGIENQSLLAQVEQLNKELSAVKQSESTCWVEMNAAQAEVVKLQAELALLKKPAPKRRGK